MASDSQGILLSEVLFCQKNDTMWPLLAGCDGILRIKRPNCLNFKSMTQISTKTLRRGWRTKNTKELLWSHFPDEYL